MSQNGGDSTITTSSINDSSRVTTSQTTTTTRTFGGEFIQLGDGHIDATSLTKTLENNIKAVANLTKDLHSKELEIIALNESNIKNQEKVNKLTRELAESTSDVSKSTEYIEGLKDELQAALTKISSAEKDIEELNNAVESLSEDLDKATRTNTEAQMRIGSLEADLKIANNRKSELQKEISTRSNDSDVLLTKIRDLETQISTLNQNSEKNTAQIEKLTREANLLREDLKTAEKQVATLKEQLKTSEKELVSKTKENMELRKIVNDYGSKFETMMENAEQDRKTILKQGEVINKLKIEYESVYNELNIMRKGLIDSSNLLAKMLNEAQSTKTTTKTNITTQSDLSVTKLVEQNLELAAALRKQHEIAMGGVKGDQGEVSSSVANRLKMLRMQREAQQKSRDDLSNAATRVKEGNLDIGSTITDTSSKRRTPIDNSTTRYEHPRADFNNPLLQTPKQEPRSQVQFERLSLTSQSPRIIETTIYKQTSPIYVGIDKEDGKRYLVTEEMHSNNPGRFTLQESRGTWVIQPKDLDKTTLEALANGSSVPMPEFKKEKKNDLSHTDRHNQKSPDSSMGGDGRGSRGGSSS
jgi:predicted  nucleic acid-binding Zn-ribbon protein